VDALPGRKIVMKGNHDYWWTTRTKAEKFFKENGITTIEILHNNSVLAEGLALCGTRGWVFMPNEQHDLKISAREAARLRLSLEDSKRFPDAEKIVFLHYPTVYQEQRANHIINTLKEYNIKRCFYGHLHGKTINYAFNGVHEGTKYKLISADAIDFCPYIID
jgi:predicted phosphohydrolase